jgi:hypothetical protein
MKATILTTPELKQIANSAIFAQTNRGLNHDGIVMLDPDGVHVVKFHMMHNDDQVRAEILVKVTGSEEPVVIWQDMQLREFMLLRTVEVTA